MTKRSLPVLVLTVLLLVSISYIIYLKQSLFSQTEKMLEARIEALEYKNMAKREAENAERQAAAAIKAEMYARRALEDAKTQFDLAVNSK